MHIFYIYKLIVTHFHDFYTNFSRKSEMFLLTSSRILEMFLPTFSRIPEMFYSLLHEFQKCFRTAYIKKIQLPETNLICLLQLYFSLYILHAVYFNFPYSSSVTGSHHSLDVSSPGFISMASFPSS